MWPALRSALYSHHWLTLSAGESQQIPNLSLFFFFFFLHELLLFLADPILHMCKSFEEIKNIRPYSSCWNGIGYCQLTVPPPRPSRVSGILSLEIGPPPPASGHLQASQRKGSSQPVLGTLCLCSARCRAHRVGTGVCRHPGARLGERSRVGSAASHLRLSDPSRTHGPFLSPPCPHLSSPITHLPGPRAPAALRAPGPLGIRARLTHRLFPGALPCQAPLGNLHSRRDTHEHPGKTTALHHPCSASAFQQEDKVEAKQAGKDLAPVSPKREEPCPRAPLPAQGSYLALRGGPAAPSPPVPLGGLSFPAGPPAPAGQQSSGGSLQSLGPPQHRGDLGGKREAG